MRIRNLYDPPALKDRDPVTPWTPDGTTASSKITDEGCEITVTGDGVGWLYPPRQDGLAKVVWEKADGSTLIGIEGGHDTVAIYPGVTVLVRLCGYEDASLVTMLKTLGLPLVFAASDHPY